MTATSATTAIGRSAGTTTPSYVTKARLPFFGGATDIWLWLSLAILMFVRINGPAVLMTLMSLFVVLGLAEEVVFYRRRRSGGAGREEGRRAGWTVK